MDKERSRRRVHRIMQMTLSDNSQPNIDNSDCSEKIISLPALNVDYDDSKYSSDDEPFSSGSSDNFIPSALDENSSDSDNNENIVNEGTLNSSDSDNENMVENIVNEGTLNSSDSDNNENMVESFINEGTLNTSNPDNNTNLVEDIVNEGSTLGIIQDNSSNACEDLHSLYISRTRKRQRNPENWKRNVQAAKRQKGEEYITHKGNTMPAKKPIDVGALCDCKKKCFLNITQENINEMFRGYHNLTNNEKNIFIFKSLISKVPTRVKVNAKKKRSLTFQYKIMCNGVSLIICQTAYRNIFQIGRSKLQIVQRNFKEKLDFPKADRRGKHETRPNKISDVVVEYICEHIKQFPAEASHYSRTKNPNKLYLSPLLSIKKMYKLYIEKCNADNKPSKFLVKDAIYRKIFCNRFNLSFGHPRSDTCSTCELAEKSSRFDEHKENYTASYALLKSDRELGTKDESVCYLNMDLQQTMPLPKLSVSIGFYLRQLWFYNFGIDVVTKNSKFTVMCSWTENIGSKGSQEILSSLYYFTVVCENLLANKTHLIVWSDSCSGQNKNFSLITLYQYLILKKKFKIIDHKFPEVGHTYLGCDREFGRIEKHLRKYEKIESPEQYRDIIRKATKKGSQVIDMKEHFYDLEMLKNKLDLIVRTENTLKQKIGFRDHVKWIRVEEFGTYLYKTSYDEYTPFLQVDIKKKRTVTDLSTVEISRKNGNCSMTDEKINDIVKQWPYISEEHKWFYENILREKGIPIPNNT